MEEAVGEVIMEEEVWWLVMEAMCFKQMFSINFNKMFVNY